MIDLFEGWSGIARVLIVGTLAYVGLLLVLRVTGKRTLSKMNAFDLIVTIALGSALASTMLSTSTPLAEGLAGMSLLVLLQFVVTWASVRSETVQDLVKARPTLLVHRGRWLEAAMRRERATREEVLAAVRIQGTKVLDETTAVLIETDGSLSVLTGQPSGDGVSSLSGVTGPTEAEGAAPGPCWLRRNPCCCRPFRLGAQAAGPHQTEIRSLCLPVCRPAATKPCAATGLVSPWHGDDPAPRGRPLAWAFLALRGIPACTLHWRIAAHAFRCRPPTGVACP